MCAGSLPGGQQLCQCPTSHAPYLLTPSTQRYTRCANIDVSPTAIELPVHMHKLDPLKTTRPEQVSVCSSVSPIQICTERQHRLSVAGSWPSLQCPALKRGPPRSMKMQRKQVA